MLRSKHYCLWFLSTVLVLGVLIGTPGSGAVQAAPQKTPQHNNVVISEFRTRGPAGDNDEFIEIFNPTSSSINIGGWEIQASLQNVTDTTPTYTFSNPTELAPGQHYLVANTGWGGIAGPVFADGTYTTDIPDDGGIALTLPDGTTVVDQVGMSISSFFKELPTLPPLAGDSDQSYERGPGDSLGNCTDTDHNVADFKRITSPNPQNLKSNPTTICIGPDQTISFTSTAPASAVVGGAGYTPTAVATSGLPVLFTIDGTASAVCSISAGVVTFNSVGTCVIDATQPGDVNWNAAPPVQQSIPIKNNQTITINSTAPASATVGGATYTPTATATSSLSVAFTIDPTASAVCSLSNGNVFFTAPGYCEIDANQPGNANYNAAPQVQQSFPVVTAATATPTAPIHLVISEFRSRGPLGAGDEFVEIYNPSAAPVNIGSWTIRSSIGCSTSITILVTMPSNAILKPGQHYLAAATGSSVTNADRTYTAGIDDNGGVGLFNYSGTVQDMAGMCDTTTYREGNFLAPLLEENQNLNQSYERKPVGATSCYDTNDNVRDFALIQPADPQNSSSPIVLCTGVVPFTPTFTPTHSPTRTPTRAPTAIPGNVVINEFLPHPRTDWNADGTTDTGDEYIEIINMGTESINVANWKLDNGAGSINFFLLPNLTLLPRQIAVFYHAGTGLGLNDMGSTVRLLKPDGRTADIFNYPLVDAVDRTWCRLPDGSGAWAFACRPTPGKPNELIKSGTPEAGTGEAAGSICMKKLAPQTVLTAECDSPGGKIWGEGGNAEIWLKSRLKFGVFVE